MPFPKVKHCIICEAVRIEARHLSTILGFYGITPDVNILVHNFSLPAGPFVVLLVAGQGEGDYKAVYKIMSSKGDTVLTSREASFHFEPTEGSTNLVIEIPGVKFNGPDRYTFQLLVDGTPHYEATFRASEGKPEKFSE